MISVYDLPPTVGPLMEKAIDSMFAIPYAVASFSTPTASPHKTGSNETIPPETECFLATLYSSTVRRILFCNQRLTCCEAKNGSIDHLDCQRLVEAEDRNDGTD